MTPSRLGFLISLALHAGVAGLVFWLLFKPTPLAPPPSVPINLSMFAPAPPQAAVAAPSEPAAPEPPSPPVAAPNEPAIVPEPAPMAPVSPPAPSAPQQEQPKITEPELDKPKPDKPNPVTPKLAPHKPAEPNLIKPKVTVPKATERKVIALEAKPSPVPPAVTTSPTPTADAPATPPAPSAPTPMPATASQAAARQDLLAAYQAALAAAIEREKFYPPLARRLNQEGIVEIGFTVLADGRIVNIHLLTQAPSAALERGAMEAIARVGLFQPIPPKLGMNAMNLTISLVYKLR